jgi:hypothetical protein
MSASAVPEGYVVGLGRDFPHPKVSHLYKGTFEDPGLPMCRRGWNRFNGGAYSIWRGHSGERICAVCMRRAASGKDGVLATSHPHPAPRER